MEIDPKVVRKTVGHRKVVVGETFHYGLFSQDALKTNQALEYYKEHPLNGQDWLYEGDMPIFIDTNVLLDLYSSSYIARETFLKFMNANSKRVIIPRHVLDEYMLKRMLFIERIPRDVKDKRDKLVALTDDLRDPKKYFENRINNELDQRGFLHEAPHVKEILQQILNNLSEKLQDDEDYNRLIEQLNDSISISDEELKIVTHDTDPILSAVCKATILNSLSNEEKLFLNKLFDELYDVFKKSSSAIMAFPGSGDKDNGKGSNVYGDFYIYHEMMSYIAEHQTDGIFLTKDVTKGDWIRKDRRIHMQYVIDMFANSGHIIHVFDASRLNVGMNPIDDITTEERKQLESVCNDNIQIDNVTEHIDGNECEPATPLEKPISTTPSEEETKPKFRFISEERFLSELTSTLKWAETYGNGFVSENFFIRDILAPKRFDMKHSYSVKDQLLEQGRIKIEVKEIEGRHFNSISIV